MSNQRGVLDAERIALLVSLGAEVLPDLVEHFRVEGERSLRHIAEALAARDLRTVVSQAHSLKGAAFTFGVLELGDMAARLEDAARNGGASCEVQVYDLRRAFAEGLTALEAVAAERRVAQSEAPGGAEAE